MKLRIFFFSLLIGSQCFSQPPNRNASFKKISAHVSFKEGNLIVRSPLRDKLHIVDQQSLKGVRKSSHPFITGDGFRSICDHIYDEQSLDFVPSSVKTGDLVFVCNNFLEDYVNRFHPKILHPYILITHNGDLAMPGPNRNILDEDKIIAWFSHNLQEYNHPKLFSLPIGLENSCYDRTDYLHGIDLMPFSLDEKKYLCYLNFSPNTYPLERNYVLNLFKPKDFVFWMQRTDFPTYVEQTRNSIFTISPRGNGLDCHRHWEALYLGTIPVIKHSDLDLLFEELPVLLIDDWEEVDERFLLDNLNMITNGEFKVQKLNLQYWVEQIYQAKKNFFHSSIYSN